MKNTILDINSNTIDADKILEKHLRWRWNDYVAYILQRLIIIFFVCLLSIKPDKTLANPLETAGQYIVYTVEVLKENKIIYWITNDSEGAANDYFELLPEKMQNIISNGEVAIRYYEEAPTIYASRPYGSFCKETNTIEIYDNTFSEMTITPLHEFGHYMDAQYQFSSDVEFRKIVDEEVYDFAILVRIKSGNYISDSYESGDYSEYFAETFAFYYAHPMTLKFTAPKTYEYMNELAKSTRH